jgi:hypothetical protein
MMNEKLLQFIWQHQYFNALSLKTEQGDPLEIIHQGNWNHNQGPDFSEAKLRINGMVWVGNIELHVLASDWYKHHHNDDARYRNIILHVVWMNDDLRQEKLLQPIPTLELQPRISKVLLQKYQDLMNQVAFIPCGKHIGRINLRTWSTWKDRMLFERLQRKSAYIIRLLQESNYHWEETLWWMLAKNFGGKINGDAFECLAKTISLNMLGRHKQQLQQLEALLFGQAGLLDAHFTESYPNLLKKEYKFLTRKYKLPQPLLSFRYLRMRPIGFPTIRLAQLAVLVQQSTHLFSKVRDTASVADVKQLLEVTANDYWHYHYHFDEPGKYKMKTVGKDMTESILINTIIPVLYAFGTYQKQPAITSKAVDWMRQLAAEKNTLLSGWKKLGLPVKTALDSQALIELKTQYCEKKRCLECAVGKELLNF